MTSKTLSLTAWVIVTLGSSVALKDLAGRIQNERRMKLTEVKQAVVELARRGAPIESRKVRNSRARTLDRDDLIQRTKSWARLSGW